MNVNRNITYFLTITCMATIWTGISCPAGAQQYAFRAVFYNVENLFDTMNDSLVRDDEYTPEGQRAWTEYKYTQKLNNIYKVLAAAGAWEGADVIGLCEVENRQVLEDLVSNTPLSKHEYGIVHGESPDFRGIDVALLYKTSRFRVLHRQFIPVIFPFDSSRTTREILHASLLFAEQDTLHFMVNHWPSRWGGAKNSRPYRIQAAKTLRSTIDSMAGAYPGARIVIMGDFNDNPSDLSLKQHLYARNQFEPLYDTALYNLSAPLDTLTIGTQKYQGHWNLLDQIIVSGNLLKPMNQIFTFPGAIAILQEDFLFEEDKKYTGKKPYRTYNGFQWQPGYSDHLPVFIDFFKQQ